VTGHTADTATAEPVNAALEFQDAVADYHKQAMRLHAASIPAGPGSEAVDSFAQLATIGEAVFPLERASHTGAAHPDRMLMWAHALLAAADEIQLPRGTVAGEFKTALTRLTRAAEQYAADTAAGATFN